MRELWRGDLTIVAGTHFTVENARIYTLPEEPLEVMVAAGGTEAAELAGRIGDGLISTAPDGELMAAFDDAGGADKPRYAQITVCWAESDAAARRTAHEVWPNAALRGSLGQELPLPSHFEAAAAMVTEDDVAKAVVCGPNQKRTSPGSTSIGPPATRTSTFTRSGPTRTASSTSTRRRSFPTTPADQARSVEPDNHDVVRMSPDRTLAGSPGGSPAADRQGPRRFLRRPPKRRPCTCRAFSCSYCRYRLRQDARRC